MSHMIYDHDFVVESATHGCVSCASADAARSYAEKVDGEPFIVVWRDGHEVTRQSIAIQKVHGEPLQQQIGVAA